MEDIVVKGNITFGGGGLHLGYAGDVSNRAVTVTDNHIVGHSRFTALAGGAKVTRNTFVAPGTLVGFQRPPGRADPAPDWNHNT